MVRLTLAVLVILAGLSQAASAGQNVLYIGDSISRGAFPYLSRYFASIGDRLFHSPGNAESSVNGVAHMASWLDAAAYGVASFQRVLVNFGIWDTNMGVPLGEYFIDLAFIIKEIHLKQPHALITFINTTPIPGRREAAVLRYNAVAAQVIARLARRGIPVSLLNVHDYMLKYEARYQIPNNAHWTPRGYQLLAAGIFRGIEAPHAVARLATAKVRGKR